MRKPIHFTLVAALSVLVLVLATGAFEPQGDQVVRGYFRLARQGQAIEVKSDADCLVYLWARNNGPSHGGVQIITPPSQFHGTAVDPVDGMVLDVPGGIGIDLGCIGGKANETISITQAYGSRVTLFVTVVSSGFATITMN